MDLVEDVDEGDAFEMAVDASLARTAAPKTSAPDDLDPLGLEAGFDELHGPMPHDADSPSESSVAPSNTSTEPPSESDREGRDALSDDGADDGGIGGVGSPRLPGISSGAQIVCFGKASSLPK